MRKFLLVLISIVSVAFGFVPIKSCNRNFCESVVFLSDQKSSLPTFDNIIAPTSIPVIRKDQTSVADRTLGSALDFLEETADDEDDVDHEFDMFQIYEESPDIEIPYDLIAELEEREQALAATKTTPQSAINGENIKKAVVRWRQHDKDCGSAEVQIAIANERIKYLTSHLLDNKKDIATRRGLNALVNQRRKLLNYLYDTNKAKAEEMVKELGIRFKPPGRLWDKEAKYGAFKNTKSKWQKLRVIDRQTRDARLAKIAAATTAAAAAAAITSV